MRDFSVILREKMLEAELPLPEGDWEWFETKFRKRKRSKILAWTIFPIAAVVASLVIVNSSRESDEKVIDYANNHTVDEKTEVVETLDNAKKRQFTLVAKNYPAGEKEGENAEETVSAVILQEEESIDVDSASVTQNHIQDGYPNSVKVFPDNRKRKPRKNVSVSPFLMGLPGRSDRFETMDLYEKWGYSNIAGSDHYFSKEHLIPISAGLDFSITLTNWLSVTTGVEVTLFRSKFTTIDKAYSQRAYYLGVPLRLDWTYLRQGPVTMWIGAGGQADRLVYCKFGDNRLKDNTFHWSVIAGAGVRYELFENVGLFLQPEVSYYFKPSSPAILTYRTDNPVMITLGAGVRFEF